MSATEFRTSTAQITSAKAVDGPPTIAVICGSTRFMAEMTDVDRTLTWAGHIVVKPGCDMKAPDPLWANPVEAEAGKARLDGLHRAKIRLAHEVYVVAPDGYIGSSTRREIAYATALGLPITYVADGDLTPVTVAGVSEVAS